MGETGVINTTDVSLGIPVVVASKSLEYLKAATTMTRLVRRDYDDEVAVFGQTIQIDKFTGMTVKDKNGDYEIEKATGTKVDVKLDKHKYIGFLIEDVAKFMSKVDVQKALMEEGIAKIGEQIDADLIEEMTDTFTGEVGVSGVDADAALLLSARTALNLAKAPLIDRYAVWSPKDEATLLSEEKFVNAAWVNGDGKSLIEAQIGRKYGIDNFMNQQIETSGTSPISTKNLAFQRGATVLATRPLGLPQGKSAPDSYYAEEDGVGLRVMVSYNHTKGGYMATVDVLYGVKTVRPELGVIVLA